MIKARSLIDVRGMPSINKLRFSYSAQNAMTKADHSRVSAALKRLRERDLKGTDRNNVMITSAKSMWFRAEWKAGTIFITVASVPGHQLASQHDQRDE